MKKALLSSVFLLAVSSVAVAQGGTKPAAKPVARPAAPAAAAPKFKNLIDSFSYAAGFNVATNMQAQGINKLNAAMMNRGIQDVFNKSTPLLTQDLINSTMQKQLDIFAMEKGAEAEKKGKAFMDANKKRPGVTTTASGLQYEVIKNGDANTPTAKGVDTVVVNYRVSLFDGEDIENSFKSGQPAVFPVMGVIKGWIEVLQLMRKGDHWKVYVPSELAYGAAGNGAAIPPFSTLKFEISLEDIKPAAAPGN
ncbi:MAG: FKBP-type peptidyl-prolyl cis-trans isomerase [Ferruginibacter sp.]|nr:FKBP-type peptidyl-prolyl cis-trans isomerase [Ferruginibacter sp.]